MKRLNIVLGIIFSIFFSAQAQFNFKGEVENKEIDQFILYKYVGIQAYPFDTIQVNKSGKFNKKYKEFDKGLYLLKVGEQRGEIVLAEEKLNFKISSDISDFPWRSISAANEDYYNIRQMFSYYDKELRGLDSTFNTFSYLREVNPDEFNTKIQELRNTLGTLNTEFETYFSTLGVTAKSAYGKKIGQFFTINPSTTKDNFLKKEEFASNDFIGGDFIIRKMNYRLMRFGQLNFSEIDTEISNFLAYAGTKNKSRELLMEGLITNIVNQNTDKARELKEQHTSEFGKTEVAKRLNRLVPPPPPTIGQVVPDIEALDKDGNLFKLSELRGQVVLIDFWASWCGPCRRESPNVVANYQKYKEEGFTVLSISADKDRNKWIKAIDHDNYTWNNHLLSADNGYVVQRDYNVRGYPTMFLVGKDGTLLATGGDLRGPGLSATLGKVFDQ